jgi:hypothetical protein
LIDREGRKKNLADALKYEGDTMRHCVGRYCDDVASGKSRIFSLRDAKGQPHVTIETRPGDFGGTDEAGFIQRAQDRGWDQDRIQRHIAQLNESNAFDPTIIQIKGKSDKKPNDEYLPFVQDFVKSGKWSDVGDLQNSGLRKTSDAWNANELKKIQDAGITVPSHATQAEIDAIGEQVWPGQWGASTKGFAAGGSVQHFDGGGAVEAQRDAAQTAANARRQQDQAAYTTAHAMSRDDFLKKYGPTFVADDKGGNPWTLDAKDFLSQVSPLMARSAFTDYEKQMGGRYSGGEGGDFTPYSDAAGNYWSQADETPQDVTLTLADGRKWTPSGAENGIVFHPKGEVTQGNLIGNGGDGDDGSREKLVNPEDYYEVSGDASRLLGKDQSGQKVTVRYKQVGDKMVPMEDATYNGYKQGLWENGLQQVAMMAAMAYGGWALAPEMAAAGGAAGGAAGSATGGALAATGLAGSLGMQAGLGATALNTGALNTGMSLVRGKNIGDSLKSGATAAFLSPISSYVGDAVGGGYTGQILGNTALGGAQGVLNGQGFGKGLQDGFVNGLASSAGSYMGGLAKGATGSNFAGTAANSLTQSTLKGKDPKATLDSLATQYATGELTDLTGLPPQVANMVVNLAQNRKPTASQAVGALSQMGNAVGSTKMKQTAVGG